MLSPPWMPERSSFKRAVTFIVSFFSGLKEYLSKLSELIDGAFISFRTIHESLRYFSACCFCNVFLRVNDLLESFF